MKLEGGADQAEVIAALVSAGIPVMAHCGLRPQSVHQLGGYKVQRDEEQLLADATAAEAAGAFAIVLECIPAAIAAEDHRSSCTIPTIGIGAGTGCDGQVLVINDLLGLTSGYVPRFVKAYADLQAAITRRGHRNFATTCAAASFPRPSRRSSRGQSPSTLSRQSASSSRLTDAATMPNRLADETSPYLLQHARQSGGLVSLGRGGARAGAGARTSRSFFRSATRPATGAT